MLSGSFLITTVDGEEFVLVFDIASGDSIMSVLHPRGVSEPLCRPSGVDCWDVLACACQFLVDPLLARDGKRRRIRKIDALNHDEGQFDDVDADIYAPFPPEPGVVFTQVTTSVVLSEPLHSVSAHIRLPEDDR